MADYDLKSNRERKVQFSSKFQALSATVVLLLIISFGVTATASTNLDVPYLHQCCATPIGFDGRDACGATSAMMILKYYGILDSFPEDYGYYVANSYTYNGYTWDTVTNDHSGAPAKGAYGYIHHNQYHAAEAERARDFLRAHGLESFVDWTPTEFEVREELQNGNPVWASTYLWDPYVPGDGGHIVVIKGYNSNGDYYIVNDPWEPNTDWERCKGEDTTYTWSQLETGDKWIVTARGTTPKIDYFWHTVDDDNNGGSSGDDDGKAEPGEDIELRVTLQNNGDATAHNVEAILSTSDPRVNITDDHLDFGDMPTGDINPETYFNFDVDSSASSGSVDFDLDITYSKGSDTDSFQVDIHGNPTQLCTSPDPPDHNFGTLGQNSTDSWSFTVENCGGQTLNWDASENKDWLSLSDTSGSLSAGNSTQVTVDVNTSGLSPGSSYSEDINITSKNGNKTGIIELSVEEEAPQLAVSPTSYDFGRITQGETPSQTFNVDNTGGGTLDWEVSSSPSWLSVSNTSGTNGGSFIATVKSGASLGSHSGSIQVDSNGGSEYIQVEVNVEEPTHTLDLDIQGNGDVTVTVDGNEEGTYSSDTQIEITDEASVNMSASPDSGWQFDGFSGDNPPFTMNYNRNTTATFIEGSAKGTLSIAPSTVTVPSDGTTTFDVNISDLTNGLKLLSVDLTLPSNMAANITHIEGGNITTDNGGPLSSITGNSDISPDGKSVKLSVSEVAQGPFTGTEGTVYQVTVKGLSSGETSGPISLSVKEAKDKDGNNITANITTQDGSLKIITGPPKAPGGIAKPNDGVSHSRAKQNGLYEDLDGNNQFEIDDAILLARLYVNLESGGKDYLNQHSKYFDFDKNGNIGIDDAIRLARIYVGLEPVPASVKGTNKAKLSSSSTYSKAGSPEGLPVKLVLSEKPQKGLKYYDLRVKLQNEPADAKLVGAKAEGLTAVGAEIAQNRKGVRLVGLNLSGTNKDEEPLTLAYLWVEDARASNLTVQRKQLLTSGDKWITDPKLSFSSPQSKVLVLDSVSAYSNPVYSGTVHFRVQGKGIVGTNLEVYTPNGEKVYRSGYQIGKELTWNRTDSQDEPVPNGIYLYRLKVKGLSGNVQPTEIKKLLILS